MMLSSGSRKNKVRWRQSGRSVGPLRIGANAKTDPTLKISFDGKLHDVPVKSARFLHLVAQEDGIVEVTDLTQAHWPSRKVCHTRASLASEALSPKLFPRMLCWAVVRHSIR